MRCTPSLALACVTLAFNVDSLAADEKPAWTVVSILADDEAFNRPHDVELSGNLAFVPGKGGSLAIVDVADAESPRVLWSKLDPKKLDDAETVLPVGRFLLLGTRDFFSLDVGDPGRPVWQRAVADRAQVDRINGMVLRGDHIFAACKHGWVAVFDAGDPAAPRLVDALNARQAHRLVSPHDIDVFGDYIVVVDPDGFGRTGRPGKVAVLRVADLSTHELLPSGQWKLEGLVVNSDLVGANRVQVSGNHAFVTGSRTGASSKIVVIDLANPASPRQAAVLAFSDTRGPNGLTVAGQVLFAAGGRTIEAVDVSSPERPVKILSQQFPRVFPEGRDDAHDLVYRDGYLYVTAQNSHRFAILKIHDRGILRLAATM